MVLFFVKTTAGQARVLNLDAGTIIPENGLMALTTDRPTEEDFQKMTKDQIIQVMDEFDIGASNTRTGRRASPQSMSKAQLVSAIMRGWDTVLAPAVEVAGHNQASSSVSASVATGGYETSAFSGTAHKLGADDGEEKVDDKGASSAMKSLMQSTRTLEFNRFGKLTSVDGNYVDECLETDEWTERDEKVFLALGSVQRRVSFE